MNIAMESTPIKDLNEKIEALPSSNMDEKLRMMDKLTKLVDKQVRRLEKKELSPSEQQDLHDFMN